LAKRLLPRKMDQMSVLGGIDKRRLVLIGLIGVGSATLLVVLAGGSAALEAVAKANWTILGLAVLVHYSSFALRGHRWQRLLAALGYPLTYLYTTELLLAGWFASALLPARAGDWLRVGVLRLDTERHQPVPVPSSLSSIVLERVLDILAILILGAAFGFLLMRDQLPNWLLASYLFAIGLLLVFGAVLVLAPPVLHWLRGLSQQRYWQLAIDFMTRFVDGLRTLFRQPATAVVVIAESLIIWLCDALVVWLVVLSLAAPLSLPAAAFIALTVDVLAAIPLTPGGVGQIDAAYAGLLALLALPALNVGAVVLVVRFITYWSFLVFSGLVALAAGFGSLMPSALATRAESAEKHAAPVQEPAGGHHMATEDALGQSTTAGEADYGAVGDACAPSV
jgi:uncharacterized protein (TIRG00374 family)